MSDNLNHLLMQLGQARPDRSLDGLDAAVVQAIARRRAEAMSARSLTPVRAFAVGFSVVVGVAAGGMAAATTASEPRQLSTFSSSAHLAPSTLLEGSAE